MEIVKNRPLNNLIKYEIMLKPKLRVASILRLAGLISLKQAKKMLTISKKSRTEWR